MPISDQGVNRERWMAILRVLIFVRRGEKFLLIQGAADKKIWANRYNGLGGHVEPGETLLDAAKRELLEESGLQADLWMCGSVLVDTRQNPGIGVFVFVGENARGEIRESREGKLAWVQAEGVGALDCVEDVPLLLARIAGMKRGEAPFAARSYYDEGGRLRVEFADPDQ